jgi:hypothetical protein
MQYIQPNQVGFSQKCKNCGSFGIAVEDPKYGVVTAIPNDPEL